MRLPPSSLMIMLVLLLTTSCAPISIVDPRAVPPAAELEKLIYGVLDTLNSQGTRSNVRVTAAQPWQDGFLVAFTRQSTGWSEDGCLYFKMEASGWKWAGGGVKGGAGSAGPPGTAASMTIDELGPQAVAIHGSILSDDAAVVEATDETGNTVQASPNNGGFLLVLSPVKAIRRFRVLDQNDRVLQDEQFNYRLGEEHG